MVKVLILGSKEYPFGINDNFDFMLSGGIEVHVEELVKRLKERHKIIIVTRKFPNRPYFEKYGGVSVHRVPWVKGFFFRNPSFNFFSFLKSLTLDFDVIICNDIVASFFGFFLSKIRRTPVVIVVHGTPSKQKQYNPVIRTIFRAAEILVYSKSSHVISVNKQDFRAESTIIGQGFDKNWFDLEKKKTSKTVFLCAGRLVKVKRLELIIRVLQDFKDYELIIMGDGPEKWGLERLAKELSVKVKFTGAYKRNDFKKALSKADFYVMTSQSEGVPYSLLEAMSSKTPIIISDIGLLDDGAAWVFKSGSVDDLKRVIQKALGNPGSSDKKVAGAFKSLDDFSWETVSGKYDSVIGKVSKN